MSQTQQTPSEKCIAQKGPYKKRHKPCIICREPSVGVTSFIFMADGTNKIGVPFCQLHMDNHQDYALPVFENQDALEHYKKEHPTLYNRFAEGKIVIFLNPPTKSQDV